MSNGGGEVVKWSSVDPRTNQVVDYDVISQVTLEQAYQKNEPEVILTLGGNRFVVKLASMQQMNSTGGSRKVVRKSNKPLDVHLSSVSLLPAVKNAALASIAQASAAVAALEQDEGSRKAKIDARSFGDPAPVVTVFDAILSAFTQQPFQDKYGFHETDANLLRIQFGNPVPAYFANANGGQSIWHRKYLSLLGLRNLVKYGPEIFLEMREKLFSGFTGDYADKTGPHKMKYYTGNVVDLDTCVLRCHEAATLKAMNELAARQGLPPFDDAAALAGSEFGKRIAVNQAKTMIDAFAQRFKLSTVEKKKRRITLDAEDLVMPTATNNEDRGRCAVWVYQNLGILTFHANVPTMSDVYGALLLAPYHLAKAYLLTDDTQAGLEDFFENAVSDSCFNAKWKSIEMYLDSCIAHGSIEDVLNRLQKDNQKAFLEIDVDDDDGMKVELDIMTRLATGASGYDPKTKQVRPITLQDIVAWHKKSVAAAA
jgi:hypothetical protein